MTAAFTHDKLRRPINIVTFTTLYPNKVIPNHGIFVENRLRNLVSVGGVASRVVAPVPWFPFGSHFFGRYGAMARVPVREDRLGLSIIHPRFPVLPKVGMTIAPVLLFAACLPILKKIIRERDFDLIDAHYFYPDGVAAVMLGAVLKKPVVITARGTDVNFIPRYVLPRRQIIWAANRASAIIAVSKSLKEAIVSTTGINPESIEVLRNGVDLKMFRPVDRDTTRTQLNLRAPTLLSVGQLIERKANHLIIEALRQLPEFVLLLAGDGPERGRLQSLAVQFEVANRVRFLGSIPHKDLPKIYSSADALVLASSREGWPNVLLEAMACGTPVIASNVWGNPEVVAAPEAGCLMESRTSDGIAAAVRMLFSALPKRSATRQYAEHFSWQDVSVGQLKLFERIVQG